MTKHHSRRHHSRYDLVRSDGSVPGPRVHLGAVLKASYGFAENDKWRDKMRRKGYQLDTNASSNDNVLIWVRPQDKKVIATVAGTHDLATSMDVPTDLAFGLTGMTGLRMTPRYHEAKNSLEKARAKYGKDHTFTIAGHSLGGAIAADLTKPDEQSFTYGRAATLGTRVQKNETAIRHSYDPWSAAAIGAQTLPLTHGFDGHAISNLRGVPLFL